MFGKGITLFRLLGFEVHVDVSWLILAVLVTWSLASGLFPSSYPGFARPTYWEMGVAGAFGLFASILFHEFCHSLVARQFGLPMKGITLFIFGGVAEMHDEPPSPKAEFFMAIAGPCASVLLGAVSYGASLVAVSLNGGPPAAVLGYLALINWILAAFNLIPAFPLDGGRVLRAALWHRKQNLPRATRIASRIGSAFGLIIIFLGVVNFLLGNYIGGLWQFMIGMFLRSAAEMSYRQVMVRRSLEGETVADFMSQEPVAAPPTITIRQLVEEYVSRYHFKMFPVKDDGRLVGCISTRTIKEIPRDQWERRTVAESLEQCTADNSVSPDTAAMQAFTLMGQTGKSRLMVVDHDRLVGIISLKDIVRYLSTKIELEENTDKSGHRRG